MVRAGEAPLTTMGPMAWQTMAKAWPLLPAADAARPAQHGIFRIKPCHLRLLHGNGSDEKFEEMAMAWPWFATRTASEWEQPAPD